MNDRQLWDQGLQYLKRVLAELPSTKKRQLSELLHDYRREKEALAAAIQHIDSEATCGECAGQCCLNGKYRINVLDLIFHCYSDLSVLPNFEHKPLCPYGTVRGCLMEPGARPADCIMFICDVLDGQLSDSARSILSIRETALRGCLDSATRLLDVPAATPLLLWAERFVLQTNHI